MRAPTAHKCYVADADLYPNLGRSVKEGRTLLPSRERKLCNQVVTVFECNESALVFVLLSAKQNCDRALRLCANAKDRALTK